MSQIEMIQAGVQVEAAREFDKLIQPLIQKIKHGVNNLRSAENYPAVTQTEPAAQSKTMSPARHIQVQKG